MDEDLQFTVACKLSGSLPFGWSTNRRGTALVGPDGAQYHPLIMFERVTRNGDPAQDDSDYHDMTPAEMLALGFDNFDFTEQRADVYPLED